MQLYSTQNKSHLVSLKEAVLQSLPPDNGLYMPCDIPQLRSSFLEGLDKYSFAEIAFEICSSLFNGYIPDSFLEDIINASINFPAPLVKLTESSFVLELFHGPSLAFKDFGARFMAQLMAYFTRNEMKELTILVATSGDTGGAVAAGFHNTPGVKVIILYPSGMVSHLQEKQLTTLGGNITALEIKGSFDHCQAIVKRAFLDKNLKERFLLSSANSINIARLIPQTFYYFEAYKQLPISHSAARRSNTEVVYSVPSGNFGNLTAGILAKKMGLSIDHFLAANNANDSVKRYLEDGKYKPLDTIPTMSNAMDVGNPSNFQRLLDLYKTNGEGSSWINMKKDISGYSFDDEQTRKEILRVFRDYKYIIDPHGAVGSLALKSYQEKHRESIGVVLETAHATKFLPIMESTLDEKISIPKRLAKLSNKKKEAIKLSADYTQFKDWMLENV